MISLLRDSRKTAANRCTARSPARASGPQASERGARAQTSPHGRRAPPVINMAARSDAQTLVALRFVDCPHAAQRLEQKVAKDKTEGVEFTPEGDTSVKQDDFHSLDFRCKIDDLDLPARLVNLPTMVKQDMGSRDICEMRRCGPDFVSFQR